MTDQEKTAVKAFAKFLVDQELPALITAEEAKLGGAYAGLIQAATNALMPQLLAAADKWIDAKLA